LAEGVERFGIVQAEHYLAKFIEALDTIARFPRAARERSEIRPPVWGHAYRSHLIVYLLENDQVSILRMHRAHADWEP
jgi:toxin ParE1/3/4